MLEIFRDIRYFVFVQNAGLCGVNYYRGDNKKIYIAIVTSIIRQHYLPNNVNSYV